MSSLITPAARGELLDAVVAVSRKKQLPEAMVEKDFWVCWTIERLALHSFQNKGSQRPNWKPRGRSRHYYDVAVLAQQADADDWLGNHAVFEAALRFNKLFYKQPGWETASWNALSLVPDDKTDALLKLDYAATQTMLFSESAAPGWQAIKDALRRLEQKIQSPSRQAGAT